MENVRSEAAEKETPPGRSAGRGAVRTVRRRLVKVGGAASPATPETTSDPLDRSGRAEARARAALRLLNIGYGNLVAVDRVVAIVSPQSSPMRRLREEAGSRGKLVNATQGRRTRSILVTDSDHIILSALNPETIAARLTPEADAGAPSE